MTFVSYAQNFEDVMLWRALKRFTPGRYIDIGAQDPAIDSVSKAFHDAGWHGIHVEPSPFYAAALRRAFPEDKVVEAAVTAKAGRISFYELPGGGLSTARADIAQFHHDHAGHEPIKRNVAAITLAQILDDLGDKPIHWMKIDVEGLEHDVLKGWAGAPQRPWIVVIESTFPTTNEPTHEVWENLIFAKGYDLIYIDGLNRFYLHQDQSELRDSFRHPPNVFDDFELSGTATSMTTGLVRQHEAELAERSSRIGVLETSAKQISGERDGLKTAIARLQVQRHLDQISATAELQRLLLIERGAAALERFNRQLDAEMAAAELKVTELDAKLVAAELRESELGAELAAATLSITAAELDRDRQQGFVADWQAKHEAQFQIAVDTAYALRNAEEWIGAARQEISQLSHELDSRAEYIARLDEALSSALRENEDLGAGLSRIAGSFWVRLLARLRLISIETVPQPLSASRLLDASRWREQLTNFKDNGPMVESIPAHVDQLLMASGGEFVDQAYRVFLRRSPDRAGREYYLGRLRAGYGKEAVLLAIADSPEARALPCQLQGMDEFRARNARKLRGWNTHRRLERLANRMEFNFGEMHARTEIRMDQILGRLESIEASFITLMSAPASNAGKRADPDMATTMHVRRSIKDTLGGVSSSDPSQFIGELRAAVRQSSEAATFSNLMR